jgi:hypothetical protein
MNLLILLDRTIRACSNEISDSKLVCRICQGIRAFSMRFANGSYTTKTDSTVLAFFPAEGDKRDYAKRPRHAYAGLGPSQD